MPVRIPESGVAQHSGSGFHKGQWETPGVDFGNSPSCSERESVKRSDSVQNLFRSPDVNQSGEQKQINTVNRVSVWGLDAVNGLTGVPPWRERSTGIEKVFNGRQLIL
jgi:hypothetical protein